MVHHHKHHHPSHSRPPAASSANHAAAARPSHRKLELVVKGDARGTLDAVLAALRDLARPEPELSIIGTGIGDINKNDLLKAATGSRLILGFNVTVQPHIAEECRRQTIEIRLYSVIYGLIEDVRALLASLLPEEPAETIIGSARVIALFKSSRKGMIVGCKVLEGRLRQGDRFRLIAAMGPVYSGVIETLHIERDSVNQALPGQEAGIKLPDFQGAKVGDLVECLKISRKPPADRGWQPRGAVIAIDNS